MYLDIILYLLKCFYRSITTPVDPIANKISKDIEVLSSTVTKALAVIKNASLTTGKYYILSYGNLKFKC